MDKKEANILLISEEPFEYKLLMEAGYKKVTRIGSMLRASEYFEDHIEELDNFDVIMFGTSTIGYRNCGEFKSKILNYVFENDIPYMNYFTSYHEEDENKLFYISNPSITSMGVDKIRFLSVLNDVIEEVKNETVRIPDVVDKEKKIPQRREDVKLLFMGIYIDEKKVEKFFKDEGFTNYTYIRSNNFSLDRNIKNFPNYDLVIVDEEYNGAITILDREYYDYQRDRENNTFFAAYQVGKKASVEVFGTDKIDGKRKVKFESLEDEEETLMDVLKTALRLYTEYNPYLSGDEYPSVEELQAKYEETYERLRQEKEKKDNRFMAVREIYNRLFDVRELRSKKVFITDIPGLKIDILQDGMSIAFMVGTREAVRVSFKDEDFKKDNNGKIYFYLEYLSNNGRMKDAGRHTVSCSYVDPDITDISDDETKKIEALVGRINENLTPIIRDAKHNLAIKEHEQKMKATKNQKKKKYVV